MDNIRERVRYKRKIPIGGDQGVEYAKETLKVEDEVTMDSEFAKDTMDVESAKEAFGVDDDASKDVEFSEEAMDEEDIEARERAKLSDRRQQK